MLYGKIDQLILDAMKARDEKKKKVLREIKAELVAWHNSKENYLKKAEYTEEVELKILKDMCTKCQENAAVYANRIHTLEDKVSKADHDEIPKLQQELEHQHEMFHEEVDRVSVLQEYIPRPATYSEINEAFDKIEDIEKSPKSMGLFIKRLKEVVKNAEGGMIAEVVKWRLGLSKNQPIDMQFNTAGMGGC